MFGGTSRKRSSLPRRTKFLENPCEFTSMQESLGFGHEGIRADLDTGRLTIQRRAVHIWCQIDGRVREFLDGLFAGAYDIEGNVV